MSSFPVQKAFSLKNGLQLTYREYGGAPAFSFKPQVPVLFFHGNMNSSKFLPAFSNTIPLCEKHGVRWVAVDRPGIGDSSMQKIDSGYSSFAKQVELLADRIVGKGQKISLVGYSSGGLFALAAAVHLGSRAASLSLICSDGNYLENGHPIYGNLQETLVTKEMAFEYCSNLKESMFKQYLSIKKIDKKAFCLADLEEAIKGGLDGVARDLLLETRKWDFDETKLSSLTSLFIYHGTKDESVPIKYSEMLIGKLGNTCEITKHHIEGESHSLIRRHFDSILAEIAGVYFKKLRTKSDL